MISLGRHFCSLLLGLATAALFLGGLAVALPVDGLPARVAGALNSAVRSAAIVEAEPRAVDQDTVATVARLRAVPRAVVAAVPTTPAVASTSAEPTAKIERIAETEPAAAPATSTRAARAAADASPAPKPKSKPKPKTTSPAAAVIAATNTERAEAGCGPLRADSRLAAAAQEHAADMAANDYFSHTDQSGDHPTDRIHDAGFDGSATGENIAYGQDSAAEVMAAWMDSSGHRRNILDCDYDRIGVGYDSHGDYWVQNFGG